MIKGDVTNITANNTQLSDQSYKHTYSWNELIGSWGPVY